MPSPFRARPTPPPHAPTGLPSQLAFAEPRRVGCLCFHRHRDYSVSLWLTPGGLTAGHGPRFSLFSWANLTTLEPRPGKGLARTPFPLLEAGDAPTPCEARQAGGLPGQPLPRGCRRAAASPRPAPRWAPARRHGNCPVRIAGRRVTHSAVASAGMRSAGPSVRSPRPEQLTRQAAPGAGPQRQGGAQGPQPRPGSPASAPSHRPRPRASARRAGGIVRAARAWPRPRARPAPAAVTQAGPADGMAGRDPGATVACLPA